MTELTTIQEIKQAVDNGLEVFAETMFYRVIKDKNGEYLIKGRNGHCVGLHGMEGTPYEDKLNASNFWHE